MSARKLKVKVSRQIMAGKKCRSVQTDFPIVNTVDEFPKRVVSPLKPKNLSQNSYLKLLNDDVVKIIFAVGVAGTGKTYMATKWAIQQLRDKKIEKIVVTRPAVSVDEKHGFLPGDLNEKMDPWLMPITDVFLEYYTKEQIKELYDSNKLEVAPMAFLRGRTFKNCIIIADEMQNSTPKQMKTLLTRIGENTKLLITGDTTQHDRGYEANGMEDFLSRFDNDSESKSIRIVEFDIRDVERSDVVVDVLNIYGTDEV